MLLERKKFIKDILKIEVYLIGAIIMSRFTGGAFTLVIALLGLSWAFSHKYGKALSCLALFPFMVVLDKHILPVSALSGAVLRIAPLLIGLALVLSANTRRGATRLPLGSLFVYLFLVTISSVVGLCPEISLMKIFNFILFILGIWLGTQNLHERIYELQSERIFFLSIIFFIIIGSLFTIPFPAIGYSTSLSFFDTSTEEAAAESFQNLQRLGMITLFSGALNQSQALAPILSCCITFVLADMLYIERRFDYFHMGLIVLAAGELYMTRSRTGLFSGSVGLFMILIYASKHYATDVRVKQKIRRMSFVLTSLLVIIVLVGELGNRSFSKWLYKTNSSDTIGTIGISEAVTGSRQGTIDENLGDFKSNPLFGIGFQVNHETKRLYGGNLFALSAPIEKGLLPLVILGEGGIFGAIAFVFFLISFYGICVRKDYIITASMFTTMLATNIGEATFFSPGGIGGILWVISVVGGFSLDNIIQYRQEMYWRCAQER